MNMTNTGTRITLRHRANAAAGLSCGYTPHRTPCRPSRRQTRSVGIYVGSATGKAHRTYRPMDSAPPSRSMVRRWFRASGYKVRSCTVVTDIDDATGQIRPPQCQQWWERVYLRTQSFTEAYSKRRGAADVTSRAPHRQRPHDRT